MNNFAAGIIPFINYQNQRYFLLGLERSNNKWSGFVGGSEPDETPKLTALREFNEETAMIFHNYELKLNDKPLIEKTSTGKTVYLWFIEFPNSLLNYDINKEFQINKNSMKESIYKEKITLKWFNNVNSNKILYKLKKMILLNFPSITTI